MADELLTPTAGFYGGINSLEVDQSTFTKTFTDAPALIDGDINTFWTPGGQWAGHSCFGVNMGTFRYKISKLRYYTLKYPGSNGVWDANNDEIRVFVSADGNVWTHHELIHPPEALQFTGEGYNGFGAYFDIILTAPVRTQYILGVPRIALLAAGGYGMNEPHEMRVYGSLVRRSGVIII